MLLKIGILSNGDCAEKGWAGARHAGPHNRLLRRQHCSSLCSQSEGHEHVANMTNALGHDFVGFSALAWPPQYSSPSLCEQSELQCFAPGLRQMSARCPLQRCRIRYAIWLKNAQRFFRILPPTYTLPLKQRRRLCCSVLKYCHWFCTLSLTSNSGLLSAYSNPIFL